NITDFIGGIDIIPRYQKRLEWVIAGFHTPALKPGTIEQHTAAYLALSENPYIDMISHCGSDMYKFDYERVIPVFAKKHIVVEINNHSFDVRKGSPENCREIALLCKKYRCPIAVTSDAHFHEHIGVFNNSLKLLSDIDFPEELVINTTKQRFLDFLYNKKGIRIE
ncbi:MAG: phosphatase, partial [Bacillota bacterium]|nr:phosphatase [Bacillota bacterium]